MRGWPLNPPNNHVGRGPAVDRTRPPGVGGPSLHPALPHRQDPSARRRRTFATALSLSTGPWHSRRYDVGLLLSRAASAEAPAIRRGLGVGFGGRARLGGLAFWDERLDPWAAVSRRRLIGYDFARVTLRILADACSDTHGQKMGPVRILANVWFSGTAPAGGLRKL